MRAVIDADGFEAKFQSAIDPWDYAHSPFEAYKRRILMRACGHGVRGRGLELACAIGVTTAALAERCLRLLAIDSSPTAIAEAARRAGSHRNVAFAVRRLPGDAPRGPFDLIVASEILYYLPRREADEVTWAIARALAPGGRLVLLHHVVPFDDAAQRPRQAQARAERQLSRSLSTVFVHAERRFRAVAFRRGR